MTPAPGTLTVWIPGTVFEALALDESTEWGDLAVVATVRTRMPNGAAGYRYQARMPRDTARRLVARAKERATWSGTREGYDQPQSWARGCRTFAARLGAIVGGAA